MKRLAIAFVTLQILVLPLLAQDAPKECTLCVGAVVAPGVVPATPVPMLAELSASDPTGAGALIDALAPEQRRKTTVVFTFAIAGDGDPLTQVEERTKTLVEWARLHGPFDGFGVAVEGTDAATAGYALKRLAVSAQGENLANRIVLPRTSLDALTKLYETGAQAYFDALVVDSAAVADTAKWLLEHDPSKKILAVVAPQSPNTFFDLAQALANGATRAYLATTQTADLTAMANFNAALSGDWAYDSTARTTVLDARGAEVQMPVLTFVRGEDLRTIIIPRGDAAAASIVSLPTDRFTRPRRVDAAGDRELTDVGRRGGRFLLCAQPGEAPFVFTVDHADKPDVNVTKETIDIATQRGITVEEIIRNHQAYEAYQETIQPRYIARNTTKLRFNIEGGDAVEAAISGDYFSEPDGRADWVWEDFFINGVRWKYGRIPELPLIQPEKVTQLPLDIHLSNEYRYQLVRETDLNGYRVYEVRFEPPPNAPESLPLYRGTVWIDKRTWARVRISMIQLNLTGEVLSNEERVDFQPFQRGTNTPLVAAEVAKADPRQIVWLPREVGAQQVISAAGRANVIQRATTFENFRIEPTEFATLLQQVSQSDARMVRETEAGLRYLEKRGDERVVKEGYDTAQLFMLGGVHHDAGLEFPVVPLGGIDYFNFNLGKKGIQTNVFFAGVIIAANATHPNVANTRTNVGADFFGIAIPTENTMYRGGEEIPGETVKSVPIGLTLRAGHPFLQFGKADVSIGVSHYTYQRAEDTLPSFLTPSDTFVISPSIDIAYARRGWSLSSFYRHSTRTSWEPWGDLTEYDPDHKTYATFGGTLAKSFYLPKFQRIGVDVSYLDGTRLDRFSKYELGFFGTQRVHGVRSGSVRAEKMIIGHLSYGFVFSQAFRLEAFYDHAIVDDTISGLRRAPFQGVGIAGQTVGPYGTLIRLDIGKTIGRNAQDGFVANVVFLKLF